MVGQSVAKVKWNIRDLEVLPQSEWSTYEIIGGELFATRSPHFRHQEIGHEICSALSLWSKQSGLGKALFAPGVILSDADNVIPDVVWISKEKFESGVDDAGHLTKMPELVVEVLSAGDQNIRRDREAKLKLYSVQGVQEYWIADRFSKELAVYRRDNLQLVLTATLSLTDTITSPLLPDFSCHMAQIFS